MLGHFFLLRYVLLHLARQSILQNGFISIITVTERVTNNSCNDTQGDATSACELAQNENVKIIIYTCCSFIPLLLRQYGATKTLTYNLKTVSLMYKPLHACISDRIYNKQLRAYLYRMVGLLS